MNDVLKVLIPATIALLGTILTIVIGYRQWKRQQDAPFVSAKQSAYKGLFEKLEEAHIKLRTEEVDLNKFRDLVRDVNSYILRNSLYLDERDRTLSNTYLDALYRFKEIVMESGDEDTEQAMTDTRAIPTKVSNIARELRDLAFDIEVTRQIIVKRCRAGMRK